MSQPKNKNISVPCEPELNTVAVHLRDIYECLVKVEIIRQLTQVIDLIGIIEWTIYSDPYIYWFEFTMFHFQAIPVPTWIAWQWKETCFRQKIWIWEYYQVSFICSQKFPMWGLLRKWYLHCRYLKVLGYTIWSVKCAQRIPTLCIIYVKLMTRGVRRVQSFVRYVLDMCWEHFLRVFRISEKVTMCSANRNFCATKCKTQVLQ